MGKRIITFGTWDGKPIEWIVLKEEYFGTLVVSKNILFSIRFDNNNNKWITSNACSYLNSDFYNGAFTYDEKLRIVNVVLADVSSKNDIFLLSTEEAALLGNDSERKTISSLRWWLRTVRESNTLWGVDTDGCIDRNFGFNETQGVHPAMYIREE